MAANHYATLGVAPDSSREVIRAAYLHLMRCYHPDKNPSAQAAARVRAITAAYAVLSVPEERAKYDLRLRPVRPVGRAAAPPEPPRPRRNARPAAPQISWPSLPRIAWPSLPRIPWPSLPRVAWPALPRFALPSLPRFALPSLPRIAWPAMNRLAWPGMIAAGVAFLVIVANVVPDWVVPEKVFERSGVGGKAMAPARPAKARAVPHPAPAVVAAGERQDVAGIVADSVEGGAPALSAPAQTGPDALAALQPSITPETLPTIKQPQIVPAAQVAPTPVVARAAVAPVQRPQPAPAIAQQKPSFNCSGERSWAEKTVCSDAALAALDRAASSLWADAMDRANAAQRASLLASDKEFVAGRNLCSTESCVRHAYLVNMSNIRETMSGTPLPR